MDEEKKIEEAVVAEKTAVEVAEESAEKAENSADKSEDSAQKAKEAAEETKEAVEEVREEAKTAESPLREASKPRSEEKAEKKAAEGEPRPEGLEKPKLQPKKEVVVSGKLGDIIKQIEGLTVLELADLVKALEERFGVSAAPIAVGVAAGAAPAAGGTEAVDEGQTTFNVVLADGGANKISVIKAVRELVPTLGLKEAKDLVDAAPKPVLEGIGKDAANEAKAKLETAGAKVELK
jgi:large subunit ribosomal protein L7/L12